MSYYRGNGNEAAHRPYLLAFHVAELCVRDNALLTCVYVVKQQALPFAELLCFETFDKCHEKPEVKGILDV